MLNSSIGNLLKIYHTIKNISFSFFLFLSPLLLSTGMGDEPMCIASGLVDPLSSYRNPVCGVTFLKCLSACLNSLQLQKKGADRE